MSLQYPDTTSNNGGMKQFYVNLALLEGLMDFALVNQPGFAYSRLKWVILDDIMSGYRAASTMDEETENAIEMLDLSISKISCGNSSGDSSRTLRKALLRVYHELQTSANNVI